MRKYIQNGNRKKPVLKTLVKKEELTIPTLTEGSMLIFDDHLLHGGMPNKDTHTRLSIEFTCLV